MIAQDSSRHPLSRSGFALSLLALFSVLFVGACARRTSDSDIRTVSIAEVERTRTRDSVILIDPRAPSSYQQGHIPGALNIQIAEIDPDESRDPKLRKADRLIVYGLDPMSAAARGMTKRLLASGYSQARMFSGGLAEWTRSGLPVETGTDEDTQPGG